MSELKQKSPVDAKQMLLDFKDALEKFKEKPAMVMCVLQELEQFKLMTHELLKDTSIGRTVNGFRKHNGSVGELAKRIVSAWKDLTLTALHAPQVSSNSLQLNSSNKVKDSAAINKALHEHYNTSMLPSKVTIKVEKTDTLSTEQTQSSVSDSRKDFSSEPATNAFEGFPKAEEIDLGNSHSDNAQILSELVPIKKENLSDKTSVNSEDNNHHKDSKRNNKECLSNHSLSMESTITHSKSSKKDTTVSNSPTSENLQQKKMKVKKEKRGLSAPEIGKTSKPKLIQESDDSAAVKTDMVSISNDACFENALKGTSIKKHKKSKSKSDSRKVKKEVESDLPSQNSKAKYLGAEGLNTSTDLESLHGSVSFSKPALEPSPVKVSPKELLTKKEEHAKEIVSKKTLALADYRLLNSVKKECTADQKTSPSMDKIGDKRGISEDVSNDEKIKRTKTADMGCSFSQSDVNIADPIISLSKLQSDLNHFMDVMNYKTAVDDFPKTSDAQAEHSSPDVLKSNAASGGRSKKASRSSSLPKAYASYSNSKEEISPFAEMKPGTYASKEQICGNSPVTEKHCYSPSQGYLGESDRNAAKSSVTSGASKSSYKSCTNTRTPHGSRHETDGSRLSSRDTDKRYHSTDEIDLPSRSSREFSNRSHKSGRESNKLYKSIDDLEHPLKLDQDSNDSCSSSQDSGKFHKSSRDSHKLHHSHCDTDKLRKLNQDSNKPYESKKYSQSHHSSEDYAKLCRSTQDSNKSDKSSQDSEELHRLSRDSDKSHKSNRDFDRLHNSSRDSDKSHKSSRTSTKSYESNLDLDKLRTPSRDSDKSHKSNRDSDKSHKSSHDSNKSHRLSRDSDKSHKSSRDSDKSHKSCRDSEKSHKSSRDSDISHKSSRDSDKSHKSSRDSDKSHKSGRDSDKSHKSSQDSDKSHKSGRDSDKSHKSSRDSDKSHKSSRDSDKSHKSSRDSDKSHKSSRDSDKSHKSSRDSDKSHKSSRDSHESVRESFESDKSGTRDSGNKSRKRKLSEGGIDATGGQSFEALLESSHNTIHKKKKPATLEQKIAKTVAEQPLPQSYLDDLPELLTDYKPLPRGNISGRHEKTG
ncbi:uncharacterized protein DDB_G0284459-like isoform X2 [Watersipora subatra]